MKKIHLILLLISIILIGCQRDEKDYEVLEGSLFNSDLLAVALGNKWGYIDDQGKVKIDFMYGKASAFYKGYAIVRSHLTMDYHLIDVKNNHIFDEDGYKYLYRDIDTGNLIYKVRSKYGLMNYKGEILTDAIYEYISDSSEGLFTVIEDGSWGYIDIDGVLTIDSTYEYANPFSQGIAVVLKDEKWFAIDKEDQVFLDFDVDMTRYNETIKSKLMNHYKGLKADQYNHLTIATVNHYIYYKLYNIEEHKNVIENKTNITGIGPLYVVYEDGHDYLYSYEGQKVNDTKYQRYESSFLNADVGLLVLYNNDEREFHRVAMLNDDIESFYSIGSSMEIYSIESEYGNKLYTATVHDGYVELDFEGQSYEVHMEVIREKSEQGFIGLNKADEKYGLVSYDNEVLIEFRYDIVKYFIDGYYLTIDYVNIQIMNEDLEILHEKEYNGIQLSWNILELPILENDEEVII